MASTKASKMVRERGTRERSPGHYELSAYNPGTGRQVFRTYVAQRSDSGTRAARAELTKLRSEIAEGKHGGSNATLGYLLDEFLRFSKTRGRAPATIGGYESNAKRIKKVTKLADKPLSRLTARELDEFYLQLQSEGMTPATLHHHHRLIRAGLNQAVKWDWVASNLALKATVTNGPSPEMHVPTLEQALQLVLRARRGPSTDLGEIIRFAVLTDARRGEICGARWSDVDWQSQRRALALTTA